MTDTRITAVTGRRVWDSRGRPTVEAEIALASGASGRAIAPAGASTGRHEAVDKRDGGTAFGGLDVTGALDALTGELAPALIGRNAADQAGIDKVLSETDGTSNLARCGGNAVIACSMAAAHAAAAAAGLPLWQWLAGTTPVTDMPTPEIQVFGGGAHASRRVDMQDFMVVAVGAAHIAQAFDWTAEIYRAAGGLMAEAGKLAGVADEGGWWPQFEGNEDALDFLVRAIERAGLRPGEDVAIALDIAATQLLDGEHYRLAAEDRRLDGAAWRELLLGWCRRYPIISIEDPCAEDDFDGMAAFVAEVPAGIITVGDDHLATAPERIADAAGAHSCTAALIKPNQAGTLTRAHHALNDARAHGWATIVSARSGETEDVTVTHLAVGWGADQLKVGSFTRSERMAKWNECLRIDEALGGGLPLRRPRAWNSK